MAAQLAELPPPASRHTPPAHGNPEKQNPANLKLPSAPNPALLEGLRQSPRPHLTHPKQPPCHSQQTKAHPTLTCPLPAPTLGSHSPRVPLSPASRQVSTASKGRAAAPLKAAPLQV